MHLKERKAERRDLPDIKRLTDEYISQDFYSLDDLEGMLHGDNNLMFVVTDADRDDAIISYYYAFLSTLDEALRIIHVKEKPAQLLKYKSDETVAVYKASSTEKEYRKHGICSSFVRDLEPDLRKRGAKLILATALHPMGREVPMKHIFLDNGFAPIAELYRPWSGIRGYCPYCKQDYCICDGVFFVKELKETGDNDFDE